MSKLLLAALCVGCAAGFYLPGVSPKTYKRGERMPVKVNKLTSTQTELPYDYYTLPFCKPEAITNAVENLGEVLHGSVIQNSPYDIFMGKSDFKVACRVELGILRLRSRRGVEVGPRRRHRLVPQVEVIPRFTQELLLGRTAAQGDHGSARAWKVRPGGGELAPAVLIRPADTFPVQRVGR